MKISAGNIVKAFDGATGRPALNGASIAWAVGLAVVARGAPAVLDAAALPLASSLPERADSSTPLSVQRVSR